MTDPGWGSPVRTLPMGLVPQLGIQYELGRARAGAVHGLVAVREIFVHLTTMAVLVGTLLGVVIATGGGRHSTARAAAVGCGVVLLGAAALAVGSRLSRPLDCSSDASLARTYVARFMLRLAFANLCLLIGIFGALAANEWWIVLLGAAVTAAGLARLAPTDEHVRAEQAELDASGCQRDLVTALAALPPAGPRTM
jgi:hypothetical protein